MEPRIETLRETKLIGRKMRMSFANFKTVELWHNFMPRRTEIKNSIGAELYSVEVYNDLDFFRNFNPTKEFEKWAAVKVKDFDNVPDKMETLIIPEGQYSVFHYIGKPSEAQSTYQYIYGIWIPNSEWELDDRPHFALMGPKYQGESADSEEEFWIPVKKK